MEQFQATTLDTLPFKRGPHSPFLHHSSNLTSLSLVLFIHSLRFSSSLYKNFRCRFLLRWFFFQFAIYLSLSLCYICCCYCICERWNDAVLFLRLIWRCAILDESVVIPAMIEIIPHIVFDSGFSFVDCFAQFIRNVWLERRRSESIFFNSFSSFSVVVYFGVFIYKFVLTQ